jgi:hypothetical protein
MNTLRIAAAACMVGLGSLGAHAKSACDIHRLGYTKAQCDECANMTWSVSRVFPAGTCVSNAAPQPVTIGKAPVAPAKKACDIHHLGYSKAQCDECSNMKWSVSKVFPRGECVGTTPPPTIAMGGKGTTPTSAGASCTLTNWGGATLALASPNFSGTGVRVSVCSKGYDLARSQLHCSVGVPVQAFNYPTTNVSCNKTVGAPVFNPQVTISGRPCCL